MNRRWTLPQVNLSLNDIYQKLCEDCKEKMVALIKDKMTEQAIRDTLEGKKSSEERHES